MNDAHTKETQRMIEVMQAYADGEQIQCRNKTVRSTKEPWLDCVPTWSWTYCDYRVKPESPVVRIIRKTIEQIEREERNEPSYVRAASLNGMIAGLRDALRIIDAQGE